MSAGPCWFGAVLNAPGECDGPMDRCHLIPKQRIKRELRPSLSPTELTAVIWHPAVWRWGCRRHHANFDNNGFDVAREQLPPALEQFAAIWGLTFSLDADFGSLPE